MTDLASRPPRPGTSRPPGARRGRPARRSAPATAEVPVATSVTAAGVLAAVRAAGLGLLAVMVLVLVAWATAADSGASATEAFRGGLTIWLVGQLARVGVPGGTFGLVPLGLTLLPAVLLFGSAVRAARDTQVRDRRGVVALTSALAATYAAVAVVVSLAARDADVRPHTASAFLGAALVALLAGGAGAVHGSGRSAAWWWRLPALVRSAVTGAAGAVAVLLAGGALLVAAMLALHREDVAGLSSGLHAGASGTMLVLLICVLYAPTAAVWGAAYLAGPGFAVGAGTSVAAGGVQLGAVPGLPLLAALPRTEGAGPGWGLVVASGLAAGLVAGVLADRAAGRPVGPLPVAVLDGWRDVLRLAGLTGALTGLAIGLLAAVASGPGGPGRLVHVGPTPWWVALSVAGSTALTAAVVLAGRHSGLLRRGVPAGPAEG